MKKTILMTLFCCALLAACSAPQVEPKGGAVKTRFNVTGAWEPSVFTRGTLTADGKEMTDLWLFDFVDGECVQALHQTPEDDAWGAPELSLAYGSHHIYFVASWGTGATLDETAHTIIWSKPQDTFWKDYAVTIEETSTSTRSVSLDRVATRVRLVVNDEVPEDISEMAIAPSVWYYGLNYTTGAPVSSSDEDRAITVPASYIGTSGQLALSFFGLSSTTEWTADLHLFARDADDNIIGQVTIEDAPFVANRLTEYSGSLFSAGGGLDVSLNATWQETHSGTW